MQNILYQLLWITGYEMILISVLHAEPLEESESCNTSEELKNFWSNLPTS